MTTGRINQVSHSLPGPGPIARPPRGVHFSETGHSPASPSTATRSPPCSIIGNGQSRPPIKACHSCHPAHRPPARLATRLRPDQLTLNTHTRNSPTINPSAGWFTPQPQSPGQPRQSQSTSLPQPGGLSQDPWPRRLCHAKPHRSNRSPSPLSRDLPLASCPLCTRSCGAVSAIANPRHDQSSSTTPSDRLPVESPGRTRHRPVSRLLHAPAQLLHVAVLPTVPAATFTSAVPASLPGVQPPDIQSALPG